MDSDVVNFSCLERGSSQGCLSEIQTWSSWSLSVMIDRKSQDFRLKDSSVWTSLFFDLFLLFMQGVFEILSRIVHQAGIMLEFRWDQFSRRIGQGPRPTCLWTFKSRGFYWIPVWWTIEDSGLLKLSHFLVIGPDATKTKRHHCQWTLQTVFPKCEKGFLQAFLDFFFSVFPS